MGKYSSSEGILRGGRLQTARGREREREREQGRLGQMEGGKTEDEEEKRRMSHKWKKKHTRAEEKKKKILIKAIFFQTLHIDCPGIYSCQI